MNSPQHKEILDYITSFVTNMNPPSLNETKEAYLGAFENVMTIWFKEYNTSSKIDPPEKVLLFTNKQNVDFRFFRNKCHTAYLIGYFIDMMDGEYEPRVFVYKNRGGNHGFSITKAQWSILKDCVENDKPQPEFIKTIAQKEKERYNTISIYKSRLAKMEGDLFPSGYCDYPGNKSFESFSLEERFSRIANKLGIELSNEINLDNLEKCEFWLKNIVTRLKRLDAEIYTTIEDVSNIPKATTYDGWIKGIEEKFGIIGCVTRYGNLNMRLEKIESAWKLKKETREWHYGSKYKMPYTNGIQFIQSLGKYDVYQDISYSSDSSVLMGFKGKVTWLKPEINAPYVCPVLIKHQEVLQNALQDAFGKKTYVPKYQVGDVLEFHNESCVYKVTRKIIGIGLLIKTDPNILYYNFDREDGYYIPCEQVDKDTSIFKVAPVAWQG